MRNSTRTFGISLLVFGCLSFPGAVRAQQTEAPARLTSELSRVAEAKSNGAAVYAITFSPYNLFWANPGLEIDEAEAELDGRIIEAVQEAGLTPMGVFPTWLFPPSARAPLTPRSNAPSLLTDQSEARISCVPDRSDLEYFRLIKIREVMFSRLARRFPETRHWIVGYEPSFPFFDCSGQQLDLDSLIPYMADTLKSVRGALRRANSEALVVAHFLGASRLPIQIRGRLVQPSEILTALAAEIERRGESPELYYDLPITAFDPSLELDRFPEPTAIVPFDPPPPRRLTRAARAGLPYGDSIQQAGNWNTSPYWADYFCPDPPSCLAVRADLAGTGTFWNQWRTDTNIVYLKPTPVSNGFAQMVMGPPPPPRVTTVLGGVTKPTVDVIPDEYFGSAATERKPLDCRDGFLSNPGS